MELKASPLSLKTPSFRGFALGWLPLLLIAPAFLTAGCQRSARPEAFNLMVEIDGVYEVAYEALGEVGLQGQPSSREMALTVGGENVPLWVEDGGDGRFGPGDRIQFIGEHLEGKRSFYNDHSPWNTYRLQTEGGGGRFFNAVPRPELAALNLESSPAHRLEVRDHLELDRLLVRLFHRRGTPEPEIWYWAKLNHLRKQPFKQVLDLRDRDPEAAEPVSLRVELRGWSTQVRSRASLPDHHVQLLLNNELLDTVEWNGQASRLIEIPEVPKSLLRPAKNVVQLRVPKRFPESSQDPIIDIVLVNWIEIDYPRKSMLVSGGQDRFQIAAIDPGEPMTFISKPDQPFTLFTAEGTRVADDDMLVTPGTTRWLHSLTPPAEPTLAYAVPAGQFLAPEAIEPDLPSNLRETTRQADYLMIAHPTLLEAVEPLAEHHRSRGLKVEVVDVRDVYDEFSHGILNPQAIRDFLQHAYHEWQPPAPRFALLVGDASWDMKNQEADDDFYADWTYRPGESRRFLKNTSTSYEETSALGHRNLIPTGHFATNQGHAASDNFMVAVDGDDFHPDIAIGRLPVVEPEQVSAIVDKTIRYMRESEVGPWRRNVLLITNEEHGAQRRSDRLANQIGEQGFANTRVYPAPEEQNNEHHQSFLRDAFDQGQVLVHFYGHGGRYIWRTGPPDLTKNHDLFTLDDLDRLAPTSNLPVVLSMTCYSGPFDHPTADSIGEKFIRLADRGAVAVLAASWRNSPTPLFSQLLVENLTQPGTIGEAIMKAKREIRQQTLVEIYNLLGDPAVPIAIPQLEIALRPESDASQHHLVAEMPSKKFAGRAIVDWMDDEGELVHSREMDVSSPTFELSYDGDPARTASIAEARVYAWNSTRRVDGVGRIQLGGSEIAQNDAATGGRGAAQHAGTR